MKSNISKSLTLALLFIVALCYAQEDDITSESQDTTTQPISNETNTINYNGRQRGTLNKQVHILSQISDSHPGVQFSLVFTNYSSSASGSSKNLLKTAFTQGVKERLLIGMQNNGPDVLIVKSVTGAFIDHENPSYYAQNFTIETLHNFELNVNESLSIAFDFFAYTSISPKKYNLQIAVFYESPLFEHANVVYNETVDVFEND